MYTATKFNSNTLLAAVAQTNWEGVPAQRYCKFGIFDVRQIIIDCVHGMLIIFALNVRIHSVHALKLAQQHTNATHTVIHRLII